MYFIERYSIIVYVHVLVQVPDVFPLLRYAELHPLRVRLTRRSPTVQHSTISEEREETVLERSFTNDDRMTRNTDRQC